MNVKPGDLAIITFSTSGKNFGKIVEVLSFHLGRIITPEGKNFNFHSGAWLVKSPSKNIYGPVHDEYLQYSGYEDKYLKKVSGLPLQEDEQTDIKAPA